MASSDDDEELKRAIAMSLQEAEYPSNPSGQSEANDLNTSDDEEVRRAIALSLRDGEGSSIAKEVSNSNFETPTSFTSPTKTSTSHSLKQYASATNPKRESLAQTQAEAKSTTSMLDQPLSGLSGLFRLDRKAMEQERLARQKKRNRSTSPDAPSKMVALSEEANSTSTLPITPASLNLEPGRDSRHHPSTDESPIQYPRGTIKRTWAFKHPRTNDIKIEEVFQTSTLNIAVLSAFDFDVDWIFSKLDPEKIKQIWIMNCKDKNLQEQWRRDAAAQNTPNLRVHFPPMEGQIKNMHSKLMLLFHSTHLRVVVPTANLNKYDWGETGGAPCHQKTGHMWQPAVMENSVFLIDLPRRSDGQMGCMQDLPFFGKELHYYLEAQQIGANVCEGILKFDFAETRPFAFIHSIGGSHSDPTRERTGLPGLSNAIRKLNLDQVRSIELDYAASSLGALNHTFLRQIRKYASGNPPLKSGDIPSKSLHKDIRIYFPTHDTVAQSTGGLDCGGTNTLDKRHYYASTFPKDCLRDYKSTRPGVLSHNKILLARGRRTNEEVPFAWVYIGSANVSESAWGSVKTTSKNMLGKLNIRNWECGVLLPIPEESLRNLKLKKGEVPPMNVFEGTLEVPFQYPGEQYGEKKPWFFVEGMQ
ncbi:phospholipase D/nuclease [Zopfia rhizophila CBS 207.26]|uniref:Phospholipase D/nuclease n=1 Tax=Zopfia rhizophila CBS 207.26 TaxID=1314779 RepID=A0A6A6E7J7_9PEZI|nr:phospholipase D/nuclease [Zopfia rhizophila CBS 207.26]